MIQTLKLLLPVLIPSWNFFDVIGASPRIEYALLKSRDGEGTDWVEFRPHPKHISFPGAVRRLLWNAWWNETMFIARCAENLVTESTARTTEHCENEIFRRIAADLADHERVAWLQFRIALLSEREGAIIRDVAFISAPRDIAAISIQ